MPYRAELFAFMFLWKKEKVRSIRIKVHKIKPSRTQSAFCKKNRVLGIEFDHSNKPDSSFSSKKFKM